MEERRSIVPLPAALVRAMESLRRVQPPPGLEAELCARLSVADREATPPRAKRRLVILGSVLLAILTELTPLLAAAQEVASASTAELAPEEGEPVEPPATEAAPGSTIEAGAPEAAGPVAAPPSDPRLSVSLLDGVRFEAPSAADLTVELHASLWFRAQVEHDREQTADYFSVPLARIALAASAFDGLVRFFLQPELAGTPHLLDAQIDLVVDPAFAVRVGQFRTPFSRSFITSLMALDFPDRGVVANTFNAGRDTGLMIYGRPFGGLLEYDVGVFNGSGINGRLGDTPAPMVMGRLAVTPFGSVPYDQTPSLAQDHPAGVMVGVNGYYRELEQTGMPNVEQQTASGGADVAVAFGPFSLQSEAFLRWQRVAPDPWTMSWGVYAQAGLFVVPRILEIAARGGWIDPSTDLPGDFVQTYEGAVSGYFAFGDTTYGQHLKLVLAYRFADAHAPIGDVPMGRSHRVTAQAQLFF